MVVDVQAEMINKHEWVVAGMKSASAARQLTRAGLVYRLRLMIFPLIAGDAGRERPSQTCPMPTSSWSTEYSTAGCSS